MNEQAVVTKTAGKISSRLLDQGILGVMLLLFVVFAYLTLARMWKNEDEDKAERRTLIQNCTSVMQETTGVLRDIKEELKRK